MNSLSKWIVSEYTGIIRIKTFSLKKTNIFHNIDQKGFKGIFGGSLEITSTCPFKQFFYKYLKEKANVKIVFFRFVNIDFKPHSAPGSFKAVIHPAFDKKDKVIVENTENKLFSKIEKPNHEFDDFRDLSDLKKEYLDDNENELDENDEDYNDDIINKDDDVDSHYNDVDFIVDLQRNTIDDIKEIFEDGYEKIENEENYNDKFSMKNEENYKDGWKWFEIKDQEEQKPLVEKNKSKDSDESYENGWVWLDILNNDQDQENEKDPEQEVHRESIYKNQDQGKQKMAQDQEKDHLEKVLGEENRKIANYVEKEHEGHGSKNQNYKKSASNKNHFFPLLQSSTLPPPAASIWNIK